VRIGLIIAIHGRPGEVPSWRHVRDQVLAAEAVGFDLAVIEDALLYPSDDGPSVGYWESVSMLGAMAAVTSRIDLGHSVINAPYRSAALTAKIAETLDEVSGGRFILGIGLGNTPDYDAFGVHADQRYSRFAEAIRIIHDLLRTGRADVEGRFHFARGAELLPRGPRQHGPPIVIAARGPKMLRLTARYADGWNWWSVGPPDADKLREALSDLDRACELEGRDPASLTRTLDLYSLDPMGRFTGSEEAIRGSAEAIAEVVLRFGETGFDEVRVNVFPSGSPDALPRVIESLAETVELVHSARPNRRAAQPQVRRDGAVVEPLKGEAR
jgi:alkanesulfonate monooxygenase SsuD/methylene tetrahydromethanopterin reductase-like flavin-dependent oxidoreductase (luciferase family)